MSNTRGSSKMQRIDLSYTTRTTCRVCGSSDLIPLFSLGNQFVNDFVCEHEDPDNTGYCIKCQTEREKYRDPIQCPIDIVLCQGCTLVQQRHTAPQELMYSRHYWYRSGVTQTMRSALEDVTTAIERTVNLQPGDIVLDIGANDGTLLNQYALLGSLVRVAVEPATNLAEACRKHCEVFIGDFWSADAYSNAWSQYVKDRHRNCDYGGENECDCPCETDKPKVVTALGMLYDLEDPSAFIADVAKVLHPNGVFVAQLQCLKQTVELADVGNYCHEHLLFYSLMSLRRLLGEHRLTIFDIEENSVNGGSYRLFVKHWANTSHPPTQRMLNAFNHEEEMNLGDTATYTSHYQQMERNRNKVVDFIKSEVEPGRFKRKKVWILGASTKGNTILQFYNMHLNPRDAWHMIEAACDSSSEKWGRVTVGTGIPIKTHADFHHARPDYALVLPYTFLNEFIELERQWLMGGGRFIVPLPVPRLVSLNKVGQVVEELL